MPPRLAIPDPMQRAIRQRCGFGCIVCGNPLYEYDHMHGYNETRGHIEEEITLLCDFHHREKTNGLLPLETVLAANSNPRNLQRGVSLPYLLRMNGARCEVAIGDNIFKWSSEDSTWSVLPLVIDTVPLIEFVRAEDKLWLNCTFFDDYNNPILVINQNLLEYSVDIWDIQFEGRSLTLRQASRSIFLELIFEPPHKIIVSRGRLLCNGVEIIIQNNEIKINGGVIRGCNVESPVGLLIGTALRINAGFHLRNVNRYGRPVSPPIT